MSTRILLTIGDINGIGPEIIIKSLLRLSGSHDLTVISPAEVIDYYSSSLLKSPSGDYKIISLGEGKVKPEPGKIAKQSGKISGLAIKKAIELCLVKKFDAVVTAPISKKALNLGGFNYDGHTEMLTDLSGAKETAMLMIHDKLSIGFASTHPPLRKVSGLLTKKLLVSKIKVCYNSLKCDSGIENPRIGVLSLNPHAGEGGLIGDEEIRIIEPALDRLRKLLKDLVIDGPFPSDSYFGNKTYSKYDMTFAMYHDQGFIPFKIIAGNYGVNYTAGLPFVRTSPDHGTAFDIAGKNIADETSMIEAIKLADVLVRSRAKFNQR
jgi:4-hydroxythreonine-4-phosphate dehydrogenase